MKVCASGAAGSTATACGGGTGWSSTSQRHHVAAAERGASATRDDGEANVLSKREVEVFIELSVTRAHARGRNVPAALPARWFCARYRWSRTYGYAAQATGDNLSHELPKILVPLGGIVLSVIAAKNYGWPGIALVAGAILMCVLMHFTRTTQVMRRAANRPIGYVDSAVMLNGKLKPGVTLLHMMAMTRALGELRTPPDTQPEHYRWTDGGGSWVDAEFQDGKLRQWSLTRPSPEDSAYQPPGA